MAKILVVDDSLSVRKAVVIALKPRQLEVLEAASGREALSVLREHHPDLVVCDVIMKDLSGFDVCKGIQDDPALAGTPVILISGIVNDQVRTRAAAAGAAKIISKPFRATELAEEVVRMLGSRVSVAAASAMLPAPAEDFGTVALSALRTVPGITLAAIVDDEGRLVEQSGTSGAEFEVLRSQLAEMALRAEQTGKVRGLKQLTSVILEFKAGIMIAQCLEGGGLLFVEVDDPVSLGLVRYEIRRMLQTLVLSAGSRERARV